MGDAVIDDAALQRLLRGEVHRLNDGLAGPVPLRDARDGATTTTRRGQPYRFDTQAASDWWARLSPLCRSGLVVPVRFYVGHGAGDVAYLADPEAIEAVGQLGLELGAPRDGKVWISTARALVFAQAHPTLVQFVRQ